jgi:hypothetical protein
MTADNDDLCERLDALISVLSDRMIVEQMTIQQVAETLKQPVPVARRELKKAGAWVWKPEGRGANETVSLHDLASFLRRERNKQLFAEFQESNDVRKTLAARNRGSRVRRNRAVAGD